MKRPTEALGLCTTHTRKQSEASPAQAEELTELSKKVPAEAAEPIKANAAKYYKPAA